MGVEHIEQGPDKFLHRKVCAFLLWLKLCIYIAVSYTAGHRKDCVTQVGRVLQSSDSPSSAMAGDRAPPQGTGVCEIKV